MLGTKIKVHYIVIIVEDDKLFVRYTIRRYRYREVRRRHGYREVRRSTVIMKYVEALLSWSTGSTSSTEEGPGDSISKCVDVKTVILTQGPSDATTHWLP